MKYISTRGAAPELEFGDVLLAGLAADGGLYLPKAWPQSVPGARRGSYVDTAVDVMWPFVQGVIERGDFEAIIRDAYSTFEADDVVEIVDLGDGLFMLELFHGPTLAFKDVALQLVGRLFDHELSRRETFVTVVGATSGDTGSAAIEACRDRDAVDIFVLHPNDRVSEVQRRQMTTVDAPNVHNIAVDGTFDDCQDIVKAMFGDEGFRGEVQLGAVNSINWARVMAQIVYYVVAADRVNGLTERAGTAPVSFTVPTGNFGNVFAGWAARSMGLAVDRFCVASNANDILPRTFATGAMTMDGVVPTLSPSMDIQVSSNFERLLFETYGRDGARIATMMHAFRSSGSVELDPEHHAALGEIWSAEQVDDEGPGGTLDTIRGIHERHGLLIDPHTAIGVAAARRQQTATPMITLATAHPAKFPDAVESATGVRPELPARVGDLFERKERYEVLPNDLNVIEAHVRERVLAS